jgi:hypothetical protein
VRTISLRLLVSMLACLMDTDGAAAERALSCTLAGALTWDMACLRTGAATLEKDALSAILQCSAFAQAMLTNGSLGKVKRYQLGLDKNTGIEILLSRAQVARPEF